MICQLVDSRQQTCRLNSLTSQPVSVSILCRPKHFRQIGDLATQLLHPLMMFVRKVLLEIVLQEVVSSMIQDIVTFAIQCCYTALHVQVHVPH